MQPRVLLSGATGLIGGELMLILAARGVYSTAVVRAADAAKARARLLDRLQKSALWRPEFEEFVSAEAGDIEAPGFGLAPGVLDAAGVVLHSAASTSFKPGADVYPVNLKAAENFAGILKKLKPSQKGFFVGTAAVTMEPRGVITEDMPFAGYANDYIRSKRDAETLLRGRGAPFVTLRPGIVLARGIDDAKLARNMLWAIPVMAELGDVPLDAQARLDFAPVDFVAGAFAEMLLKSELAHDCYHVSTGEASVTFETLARELSLTMPGIKKLGMRGRDYVPVPAFARQRWMFEALQPYLPFLTADAVFSNARLRQEIGTLAEAPPPVSYLGDMLGTFSLSDAVRQMYTP
ncbi:MAG: NAD-dependent epimerase/dehydratase family protein [Polaromonas sp.]|nr:NAD-dependent epimerase/dehydratase family protein [Polaromonas sp.]